MLAWFPSRYMQGYLEFSRTWKSMVVSMLLLIVNLKLFSDVPALDAQSAIYIQPALEATSSPSQHPFEVLPRSHCTCNCQSNLNTSN